MTKCQAAGLSAMPPIHRIDGVEVEQSPLSRVKEAHIIAGGVLIGYDGSFEFQGDKNLRAILRAVPVIRSMCLVG